MSQQFTMDQAYRTEVGAVPFSGDKSTEMDAPSAASVMSRPVVQPPSSCVVVVLIGLPVPPAQVGQIVLPFESLVASMQKLSAFVWTSR